MAAARLTAVNEAIRIRRQLADTYPDAFLPDLAEAPHNQSLGLPAWDGTRKLKPWPEKLQPSANTDPSVRNRPQTATLRSCWLSRRFYRPTTITL